MLFEPLLHRHTLDTRWNREQAIHQKDVRTEYNNDMYICINDSNIIPAINVRTHSAHMNAAVHCMYSHRGRTDRNVRRSQPGIRCSRSYRARSVDGFTFKLLISTGVISHFSLQTQFRILSTSTEAAAIGHKFRRRGLDRLRPQRAAMRLHCCALSVERTPADASIAPLQLCLGVVTGIL